LIDQEELAKMVRIIVLTGVMTMQINWFWLIVGLLPYSIKRQQTEKEQIFTVKALLWRLTIHQREDQCSWDLYIPLIEQVRQ
jgi:hypothetical protein